MKRRMWFAFALLGIAAVVPVALWIGSATPESATRSNPGSSSDSGSSSPDVATAVSFEDVAQSSGITFRHIDGATPTQFLPEVMGSGVAWLDYDRDGHLDLFVTSYQEFDLSRAPLPGKASNCE